MNCKHVQELLPLQVGGDLEEKGARLVAAHTQECSECASLLEEYRDSRALVLEFSAPTFGEAMYSDMRQNVLREIRREPESSAFSLIIASLFQPPYKWAATAALLLAVFGFAVYFGTMRRNDPQPLANKQGGSNQATPVPQPSVLVHDGLEGALTAISAPPTHRTSSSAPARIRRLSSSKSSSSTNNAQIATRLTEDRAPALNTSAVSEKIVRLEMQTKDPNIRIIWFTHQRPEGDSLAESSKGI